MSSMSSSLLKERETFNKRQAEASNFLVNNEKRQKTDTATNNAQPKAARTKQPIARSKTTSDLSGDSRQTQMTGPKFRILQNIVDKLKERFQTEEHEPMSLDDMIREFDLKIEVADHHWLASQALLSNVKIEVTKEGNVNKFSYKPTYDLRGGRTALLDLIKSRHEICEGGVALEDVRDSMTRGKAERCVAALIKSGEIVKKNLSRKDILFYADREHNLQVNTEFRELWGKTSIDGEGYNKMIESLKKSGFSCIVNDAPRQSISAKKKARNNNRKANIVKFNQHVKDQLQDFSEGFGGK